MALVIPTHPGDGLDATTNILAALATLEPGDTFRFTNAITNSESDEWLLASPGSYSNSDNDDPGAFEIPCDNVIIEFEDGVVLKALSGSFLGRYQCMIRAKEVDDITFVFGSGSKIQMLKDDYITGPFDVGAAHPNGQNSLGYFRSEFRHCIKLIECDNVHFECADYGDMHLTDSGGDGLCIYGKIDSGTSALRTPSTNITANFLGMHNNTRQGCSVLSIDGMYFYKCIFSNSAGMSPHSGIDLEPSHPMDSLMNIIIEDCVGYNSASRNFMVHVNSMISTAGSYPRASYLVDILFVRNECVVGEDTRDPWGISITASENGPPSGTIRFLGYRATDLDSAGIAIIHWNVNNDFKLVFDDAILDHVADVHDSPVEIILYGSGTGSSTGGIWFNRMRVIEDQDRLIFDIDSDGSTRPAGGVANCIHGLVLLDPDGITPTVEQADSNYPNLEFGTYQEGFINANRLMSLF